MTQGLLRVWQHGVNMMLDPIVAFVVGERDVAELTVASYAGASLDREIETRANGLRELLSRLIANGFSKLYLHGIERDGAIAAAFDEHFVSLARELGIGYLDPAASRPVVEQIVDDRIARRSMPIGDASRIVLPDDARP